MATYPTSLKLTKDTIFGRKKLELHILPESDDVSVAFLDPRAAFNGSVSNTINCIVKAGISLASFVASPVLMVRDISLMFFKGQDPVSHISSMLQLPFYSLAVALTNIFFAIGTLIFTLVIVILVPLFIIGYGLSVGWELLTTSIGKFLSKGSS